jgi:hypothetical protein
MALHMTLHMALRSPAQGADVAGHHRRHFGTAQVGAGGVAAGCPGRAGLVGMGLAAELHQEDQRVGVAGASAVGQVAGPQRAHAGQRGVQEDGRGLQVVGAGLQIVGHWRLGGGHMTMPP